MKPAQERNQECLPPKKRDLPVSSGGGGTAGVASTQSSGASSDTQGGATSGEWLRAQPGLHYGVEGSDGIPTVPVDQYSMLYKVALPSVTYSPTSLHPVLSHISQAYTVHSPLLQHPGIPYPHLGYAQIPHSSLQFVSPPYAAVPYAVPPGFVPSSLISPSGTIPQPHTVSHLVPYSSVIQEGVVSPPPQAQVAAHTFAKVAASSGIPLMLPSEQATQQHLGTVGVLPAAELSPRGMPVFYHPQGARVAAAPRDPHGIPHESEPEMNGGDKEQGAREVIPDSVYTARNARLLHVASSSVALEHMQDRGLQSRRMEERSSPGQRSTPDSDLEVQQVVGRLASSVQSGSGGRKEVSFAPLNLSQGSQRAKEVHGESPGVISGRTAYTAQPVARVCLPDRAVVELTTAQQQQQLPQQPVATAPADLTQALAPSLAPASAPCNPSHFMKGAIIQLATGELKRVEDLQTQDFVRSAEVSGGLKIDSSMVVDIRASQQRPGLVALHFTVGEQQSKVTIDVPPEHPFFVFGQGWSSCSPERTAQLYGLTCHHLQVGDVCVSITLQQHNSSSRASPGLPLPTRPNRTSAEHSRSQSSYQLHTEGSACPGAGMGAVQSVLGASQRRWSSPGLQRYAMKGDEGPHPQISTSGSTRPSFIPQEVKLSIEGRSNAGK
uniref:Ataxin 1 like n=1 Tax=Myripristis murdjan TaxID=586833 RepID=A0A667WRI9_9TELE